MTKIFNNFNSLQLFLKEEIPVIDGMTVFLNNQIPAFAGMTALTEMTSNLHKKL